MNPFAIRTVNQVEIEGVVEFSTRKPVRVGDCVFLKIKQPDNSPIYGTATITRFLGPGRKRGYLKFAAVRIH